jgi:hypothetical protein
MRKKCVLYLMGVVDVPGKIREPGPPPATRKDPKYRALRFPTILIIVMMTQKWSTTRTRGPSSFA